MADITPSGSPGRKLEKTPPDYLQVNVRGKDPGTWRKLRSTLIGTIEQLVAGLHDTVESNAIQEEARKISVAAMDYAKAKLERPGLENAKLEAEVLRHYAEREKALSEARVKNAEAEKIELANTIKKLKLNLGMAKVLLIGEEGDEAALFGLQIEEFLRVLKEIDEITKSHSFEAEKRG